jgi:hypothetical protein
MLRPERNLKFVASCWVHLAIPAGTSLYYHNWDTSNFKERSFLRLQLTLLLIKFVNKYFPNLTPLNPANFIPARPDILKCCDGKITKGLLCHLSYGSHIPVVQQPI